MRAVDTQPLLSCASYSAFGRFHDADALIYFHHLVKYVLISGDAEFIINGYLTVAQTIIIDGGIVKLNFSLIDFVCFLRTLGSRGEQDDQE